MQTGKQNVVIVNLVPTIVPDDQAKAILPALQTQIDRDFLPAWKSKATAVTLSFASAHDDVPEKAWPIYLNRHSTDAGALGWHDDEAGKIFSRVFVGDCIRYDLDWHVTVSHELLELILDPNAKRVWKMPDGRMAAFEACDAVEADELAYSIDAYKVSDFVLPAYFSTGKGPWSFRHNLSGPCPDLMPGGYMGIEGKGGVWTQVTADRADGMLGRRALMQGHRRDARARRDQLDLEVVTFDRHS